jgi:hypothetical protein
MSETRNQLFAGLGNFAAETKAEFSRLGTQGAMEIASALFNGNGFVPYGPGQYTPSPELGAAAAPQPEIEPGMEQPEMALSRGMER